MSRELGASFGDALWIVIGTRSPAAQYDVTRWVSSSPDDTGIAFLVDTDKTMRGAGRAHGINGDLQAAVRAIFEPDRHGKAAGHLPMGLAFRSPSADCGPTDQVG